MLTVMKMSLFLLPPRYNPDNPRPVIALGNDTGHVDGQGIDQHIKNHDRWRKKAEHPERQNRQPVDHFGPAGFQQVFVEIIF